MRNIQPVLIFILLIGVALIPYVGRKISKLEPYLTSENKKLDLAQPDEGLLMFLLEFALQAFVSWNIAYLFVTVLRLPSYVIYAVFGILIVALSIWSIQYWKQAFGHPYKQYWFAVLALVMGIILGYYSMITQPNGNGDDVEYFHRALVQVTQIGEPVLLTDVAHNTPGLPVIVAHFIMPSYEYFVAMGAHAFGIDPLLAIHKLAPFITAILVTLIHILIYRMFGLQRKQALAGIVFIYIFLLIDVDTHRSLGNYTYTRLWHGKTLVWTFCMPFALLSGYRFLQSSNIRDFVRLTMITFIAPALSPTGLFLIPGFVGCMAIAHIINEKFVRSELKKAALLTLPLTYAVLIISAIMLDLLPSYDFANLVDYSLPQQWSANLFLVTGGYWGLIRNIAIAVLIPIGVLGRHEGRFLSIFSLTIFVIFLNPLTGNFWIELVSRLGYWRFNHLLPVLVSIGLLGRFPDNYQRIGSYSIIAVIIGSLTVYTAWKGQLRFYFQDYSDDLFTYRFVEPDYQFVVQASEHLVGSNLLAPHQIVEVAPLLYPDIRLETQRPFRTEFMFIAVGDPEEGYRRKIAQEFVECSNNSDSARDAFFRSLQRVDTVVMKRCDELSAVSAADQDELFNQLIANEEWELALEQTNYLLLKKR